MIYFGAASVKIKAFKHVFFSIIRSKHERKLARMALLLYVKKGNYHQFFSKCSIISKGLLRENFKWLSFRYIQKGMTEYFRFGKYIGTFDGRCSQPRKLHDSQEKPQLSLLGVLWQILQLVHLEAMLWVLVLQWMSTYKVNEAIVLNFSEEYSPAGCFQRIQLLLLLWYSSLHENLKYDQLC